MSSDADDDRELDEPALRPMRAVWLSMRDEEPPSSGLAELLAAARVQVEAMRPKEPWWRLALAAMRRPPVLALATVLVLLGGAVVIGSHRDQLDAMPEAASRDLERGQAGAAAMATAGGGRQTAAAPELAKDGAGLASDPASKGGVGRDAMMGPTGAGLATPAGAQAASPPTVADHRAPANEATGARPAEPRTIGPGTSPPGVRPDLSGEALERKQEIVAEKPPAPMGAREIEAGASPGAAAPANSARNKLDVEHAPARVPMPAPAPPAEPKGVKRPPPKQDLQIADDLEEAPVSGAAQTTGSRPRGRTFAADEDRAEGGAAGGRRGPSLDQLAKQAETAASRSDCAAVRAIMGRIRKLDAEFHKQHLQRNAAVQRCVK